VATAQQRIGKSPHEREELAKMLAAVAAYRGPIQRCPLGVPRAHTYRRAQGQQAKGWRPWRRLQAGEALSSRRVLVGPPFEQSTPNK
jgi:hypothetical protein